jgi:hypothetical protein
MSTRNSALGGLASQFAAAVRRVRDVSSSRHTLYRAVGPAEYCDLLRSGSLASVPEAMEYGKWFAERPEDARRWGEAFYGGGPFSIIKAAWRHDEVEGFHFCRNLDQIGPARCVPRELWPSAKIGLTLRLWDR